MIGGFLTVSNALAASEVKLLDKANVVQGQSESAVQPQATKLKLTATSDCYEDDNGDFWPAVVLQWTKLSNIRTYNLYLNGKLFKKYAAKYTSVTLFSEDPDAAGESYVCYVAAVPKKGKAIKSNKVEAILGDCEGGGGEFYGTYSLDPEDPMIIDNEDGCYFYNDVYLLEFFEDGYWEAEGEFGYYCEDDSSEDYYVEYFAEGDYELDGDIVYGYGYGYDYDDYEIPMEFGLYISDDSLETDYWAIIFDEDYFIEFNNGTFYPEDEE
jgi:hypothetical protein